MQRVCGRAVLGIFALLAANVAAQDMAPTLADCDMPGPARVLQAVPASGATFDARAVWLDRRHLRWPAANVGERFRLHHSSSGALKRTADGKITGADETLELDVAPAQYIPSERFKWVGAGKTLAVRESDLSRLATVHRGQVLLTHEDAQGRVLDATAIQLAGALDDLYSPAVDAPELGATLTEQHTAFGVWAPTARNVSLCLHDTGSGPAKELLPMQRDDATGVWRATAPKKLAGRYYTYLVDVFAPSVGVVRNRVTDPYSLSLTTDSQRTYIADLAALEPLGWQTQPRPSTPLAATDLAIYELHVRDFSIGDASVPEPHRGKYLAFTNASSRGMQHLRALAQAGITDIHLLPVFDIATIPERGCVTPTVTGAPDGDTQQAIATAHAANDCYNWGYDPFHYTAPEGSYATDASDGAVRIREFRQMVMALHAAGLRVGMDVVYNHTSASGQAAHSVLDRIVPGYYQRLDATGAVATSTCCANTATENAMMARLMIDSAVTWARDYRIDSFRFDLMGHQPRAAMERLQREVDTAAGRHIHLLGEGWNFGEIADGARFEQASQRSLNGSGIGTFSDRARDAARGGSAGDNGVDQIRNQGWLNGQHDAPTADNTDASNDTLKRAADLLRVGLAGSLKNFSFETASGETKTSADIEYAGQPAGYVSAPGEVVNYVENHDNQTLFDANVFKLPADTTSEDRARVQILGAALVAFSQGIAYFHAGQDILRSKSMDRNSFDSGDAFNRLDWTYTDNGFGRGLPPAADNAKSWEWVRPRLADASIKPAPETIAWTRDAFRDLLRIRKSSSLFHLRTTQDVQQRLRFLNTGPAQEATVLVGHLDGRGHPGAAFDDILYLLNADVNTHTIALPAERGKPYRLHPVHTRGTDTRSAESSFDPATGTVHIPPRTAVVYVVATAPPKATP